MLNNVKMHILSQIGADLCLSDAKYSAKGASEFRKPHPIYANPQGQQI